MSADPDTGELLPEHRIGGLTMAENIFIDEIRATRDRIARDCGYDLHKIMEQARKASRDLGFTNRVKVPEVALS